MDAVSGLLLPKTTFEVSGYGSQTGLGGANGDGGGDSPRSLDRANGASPTDEEAGQMVAYDYNYKYLSYDSNPEELDTSPTTSLTGLTLPLHLRLQETEEGESIVENVF